MELRVGSRDAEPTVILHPLDRKEGRRRQVEEELMGERMTTVCEVKGDA
jgi:hypothetical protein